MSLLIRRNPVRDMVAFQSAVDRLFEDAFRSLESTTPDNVLAIDVHESESAYMLLANVPGIAPSDLEITVHDGVLSISGELRAPEAKEGIRVHIQERPFGKFTRTIKLPRTIDTDKVEARFEHGMLLVTLPKVADAQPRQISVKAN